MRLSSLSICGRAVHDSHDDTLRWQPSDCMRAAINVICSPEECMLKIAHTINRAHEETSGVCVVLENVAGGVCHHLFWLSCTL